MSLESVQDSVLCADSTSDDAVSSHHGSALRWGASICIQGSAPHRWRAE